MAETSPRDVTERSLEFGPASSPLFRYVYEPHTLPGESPRPYLHPVRSIAGREITTFRPEDHPWHHGISFTCTDVNEANFWGGPTYVKGRDYVELHNQGVMRHNGWEVGPATMGFTERLTWLTRAGATLLTEQRRVMIGDVRPEEGWWRLDFSFALTNPADVPVVFSSPGAKGRDSGYGGLFWRGHPSFNKGTILAGGGGEGPGMMGQRAPWLAYVAPESWLPRVTVVVADHPENPGSPVKWFVRDQPYACIAPTFMYDTERVLPAGGTATFRYRFVIADGAWSRDRIELILKEG